MIESTDEDKEKACSKQINCVKIKSSCTGYPHIHEQVFGVFGRVIHTVIHRVIWRGDNPFLECAKAVSCGSLRGTVPGLV